MDYDLRADQMAQRDNNVWRGVGVATFVEAAASARLLRPVGRAFPPRTAVP